MFRESNVAYQTWARRLRRAGLAPVAVIALEMIKPAGVLFGQMLEMASAFGGPGLSSLAKLCEHPEGLSALQSVVLGEESCLEELGYD